MRQEYTFEGRLVIAHPGIGISVDSDMPDAQGSYIQMPIKISAPSITGLAEGKGKITIIIESDETGLHHETKSTHL